MENIPYTFDCLAEMGVHLLLGTDELHGLILQYLYKKSIYWYDTYTKNLYIDTVPILGVHIGIRWININKINALIQDINFDTRTVHVKNAAKKSADADARFWSTKILLAPWHLILLQRRVWSMVQIWSGQPSVGKIVFVDTTCTMAA